MNDVVRVRLVCRLLMLRDILTLGLTFILQMPKARFCIGGPSSLVAFAPSAGILLKKVRL